MNQLECKLLEKEAENKALSNQLQLLSNENNTIESELNQLKLLCNSLITKEGNYALIQSQLNDKEAEITKLKTEVVELSRDFINNQFKLKLQYEKDVSQVKYQQENYVAKVDNAVKIEKLNEIFYNKILELENMILQFKKEEQKQINSVELKHQNQIASFKKKMIDYLKDDKRSKSNSSYTSDLNLKLTNLHVSELVNELEFQSHLIESLIQENHGFKKTIEALANDIKIHRQVENCLCEKNKKFQKQLQIISKPMEGSISSTSNNNINNLLIPNCQSKSFYSLNNHIKGNRSKDMSHLKTVQWKKDLVGKEMQIEAWKAKYDAMKSKLDSLNKKYAEIIHLCDDALKEIYLSTETKVDELYLSLDEFQQCDFSKMTPHQKYAALVIIIKYILPLVNKEVVANGALNTNVDQIKAKVYYDRNMTSHKHLYSNNEYAHSSSSVTAITESGYIRKNFLKHIKYTPLLSETKYRVKKPSFLIANNKISFDPFSGVNNKQNG